MRTDQISDALNFQVSRKHKGQGTQNVCALFEYNYIEFIWVNNELETSKAANDLLERSKWETNGRCPFGICFRNNMSEITTKDDIELYRPEYIPQDRAIEICRKTLNTIYPDTFCIPYAKPCIERTDCEELDFEHPIGKLDLKGINITYPKELILDKQYIEALSEKVSFTKGDCWHAYLLINTNKNEYSGQIISSNNVPLSLYIYNNNKPCALPISLSQFASK